MRVYVVLSISFLYPHDCKKLVQVCRGIQVIQKFDSNINAFQMVSVRDEANFMHDDIFNMLIICFSRVSQLHR